VPFFRILQHLLPDGAARRPRDPGAPGGVGLQLWRFLKGLAGGAPQEARDYIDAVYGDAFPATTRELPQWQRQFGLYPPEGETQQRQQLDDTWSEEGGQSPAYLQSVLQAAGFNVYVHDWWSSGPPYVARDPRDYTEQPRIGTVQCSADVPTQPQCTGYAFDGTPLLRQPQCNRFLANEIHYIVNKDLSANAPPPIPNDPLTWPCFMYIGGETFPNVATVEETRRDEFERLVLKHRPLQLWVVFLVDYSPPGAFDNTFDLSFG
jgi:hypothetical protein